ncbi:MAG: flagellin [Proteobacteria bacterium]|nr:flagellin [Pseudomonadota bacterium]
MTGEVVLSAALRSNLLSLQRTQTSIDKVQNVLSTGLKVSSALDNPQNFFASQSLKNRSSDLTRLLDGIGQSIQTIKAADAGVTALTRLVDQADSLVEAAREAVSGGEVKASITGNVDLRGKSDVTQILGIANTDEIDFEYTAVNGALATATVTVATGDSIDQLLSKINDIGGGGFFQAKLTTEGYLQITELRGNSFNIAFDSDQALAFVAGDSQLAGALGFGNLINASTRNGAAAANANAELTVLAQTKLVSGTFFENGAGNGFAEASDLLTNVVTTEGGSTARFAATGAPNLTIRINGTTTSSNIAISATTTIQGLVDSINTDSSINALVKASYDATTGKFNIEAIDSTVQTVNITATSTAAAATNIDFDFGTDPAFITGATIADAEGETYYLASAAATLERLTNDYNTVLTQIDELVEDAGYRGTNLLNGDDLVTYFNEDRTNFLTTQGTELTSSGLAISKANFNTLQSIEGSRLQVQAAKETLRNFGSTIANSLSIIQTRENFTKSMVEALTEGSDKLTIADQNEEGAKLLALQTRQQLGVTALSLASQAQQSVLRLF